MPTTLITGANRGLGLEFARQYAGKGWQVIATCRKPQDATALAELAAGAGGRVEVAACDMEDRTGMRALAATLRGRAIDLLLCNAGAHGPRGYGIDDIDEEAWIEVMRINAIGPLHLAGAFADHVAASAGRMMAFVSSRRGSNAENNWGGHYIYGSSKAALNAVVKSLSVDMRPRGITCVLLTPGWVRTDMGGAAAPIDAATSVAGMIGVLDRSGPDESGRFFQYDGREIPW